MLAVASKRRPEGHQPIAAIACLSLASLAQASVITGFVLGRLQRFTRSDFRRLPTEHLDLALARLS